MRKLLAILGLVMVFLTTQASAASLTDTLMKQLGVNEKQAAGGAGSLLKYAKGNLSADDFAKVGSAIPDVGSLLSLAPSLGGGKSSGLGAMASKLGGDSLGGMAGVASAFKTLGLDASMVQQFVPVILEYVQGSGGNDVMQLLQGAFK